VRAKGGHRFNPSSREFGFAYRALATNLLLKPVKASNCQVDADNLLLSLGSLTKPQKRKRDDDNSDGSPARKVAKLQEECRPESIEDFVVPTVVANILVYIAGHVLKRVNCTECALYSANDAVVGEERLFLHFKNYSDQSSAFGSLVVPSETFSDFLKRVDNIFVCSIPHLLCSLHILRTLIERVDKQVPFNIIHQKLCPRHLDQGGTYIQSIVKLYLRCRLHYYFKYETRKLLQPKYKKNRKAQVLMHH
jgi:hypothetical protein